MCLHYNISKINNYCEYDVYFNETLQLVNGEMTLRPSIKFRANNSTKEKIAIYAHVGWHTTSTIIYLDFFHTNKNKIITNEYRT